MRSPINAPRPPISETTIRGKVAASFASAIMAGAVVKTEVKNIPAINELIA